MQQQRNNTSHHNNTKQQPPDHNPLFTLGPSIQQYPDHHTTCYNIQLPSISDFYNIGHLSQQDHDLIPDDGILKC
jgi:hypothetical protein